MAQLTTVDVPLRADLGVEVCVNGASICTRTPFSGVNVLVTLKLIKDVPQVWEGEWSGLIDHDGQTFLGRVVLKAEEFAAGFTFRLSAQVEDSETVLWFENLSQLGHTEIRGKVLRTTQGAVTPYLYLSQPLRY